MKNLSEILPAEAAAAAMRWELPAIHDLHGPQPVTGAQLHTAEHLDALEQAAYQDGLQRGHAEGYVAGMRDAQAQGERLQALLDCMSRPFRDINEDVERTLVRLAVEVARKLVDEALELDPARTAAAVHEAVAALAAAPRELRVHVQSDDALLLKETLKLNTEADWKIVADSSLHRGDVRIVTDSGRVDATLDTRQTNITRSLLGEDA